MSGSFQMVEFPPEAVRGSPTGNDTALALCVPLAAAAAAAALGLVCSTCCRRCCCCPLPCVFHGRRGQDTPPCPCGLPDVSKPYDGAMPEPAPGAPFDALIDPFVLAT